MKTRLDEFERRHGKQFDEIRTAVASLAKNIIDLTTLVRSGSKATGELDARVKVLESEFDKLEAKVDKLDRELDAAVIPG